MKTIRDLKKYEIPLYLIITFLFTWIFWSIAFTLNGAFRLVGAFMPSVMAIIFTSYFYGKKGIKELLKKLTIWKVNPLFYVFALFYTAASIYIPSFICISTGANYKIHINNQISVFHLNNPFTILAFFLAIIVFGGPLGEELGWRGFVLPKLQKKFTPLISSIILGFIWTCWHIPMFLFHIEGYNINFIVYLLQTIYLTIIITWLYNHTNGSLLIPILYHSVDNFILSICFPEFLNYFNRYTIIYWIMQLIVLLCIIFDMIRKSSLNYKHTCGEDASQVVKIVDKES